LPTQPDEGFDIPTQIPQRVALELERGLGLVRVLELAPVPVLEQHRQQPS